MKTIHVSYTINLISFSLCPKVSQDVPKYSMVAGERAVLRGLNLEGLRRRGFNVTEVGNL